MFFVIWGHCGIVEEIDQYIYSFHMPAYFMISGMVFSFNKEFRFFPMLKKKVKGLLIPYVVLNLYVIPVWYINTCTGMNDPFPIWKVLIGILFSNRLSGFPMASNTTWFITCLFLTEIIFFVFRILIKKDRIFVPVLIACWIAFYFLVGLPHSGGGFWHVESAVTAVMFYLAGYLFMKHFSQIKAFFTGHPVRNAWIISGLFIVGFATCFINGRVSMIGDDLQNPVLFFISALSTSFATVLCFVKLSEFPKFGEYMHVCDRVGKATLPYIAFQTALIKIMIFFIPLFHIRTEPMRVLISLIIYFAFLPAAEAINRITPFRKK